MEGKIRHFRGMFHPEGSEYAALLMNLSVHSYFLKYSTPFLNMFCFLLPGMSMKSPS